MNALALDIGGANLKSAHSAGRAWSVPFALWKEPKNLAERLRELANAAPPFDVLLVTMTGELCDCFATKREGVEHILGAVMALATGKSVQVWTTTSGFVGYEQARAQPLTCAAANWHALATFVARLHPHGTSLLIDTGSTTTDIIPLRDCHVMATGKTDTDRLRTGELVYIGAKRTPLMALGPTVLFRGQTYRVMAEYFATTADVFVLTGDVPEEPACHDTADSRRLDRRSAAARVLRMIGADLNMLDEAAAVELAHGFAAVVRQRIAEAVQQVAAGAQRVILSGSGAFLSAQALPDAKTINLSAQIGPAASNAACAYALLQLFDAR